MRRHLFRANNLLALLVLAGLFLGADSTDYALKDRKAMLRQLDMRAFAEAAVTGVAVLDRRVMAAMTRVPRHRFVPAPFQPFAYADVPIPLGHGQNLSTPFLIALMTDLAHIGKDDIVYETGTGAGYQTAVLAELGREIYSVEVIRPLAAAAAARLKKLGYRNVETRLGDGYFGWPERGPFDAILVKEAVDHVPAPLVRQLKRGGRMVIPVGPQKGTQDLLLIEKRPDGSLRQRIVLPVRFSPLQGGSRI